MEFSQQILSINLHPLSFSLLYSIKTRVLNESIRLLDVFIANYKLDRYQWRERFFAFLVLSQDFWKNWPLPLICTRSCRKIRLFINVPDNWILLVLNIVNNFVFLEDLLIILGILEYDMSLVMWELNLYPISFQTKYWRSNEGYPYSKIHNYEHQDSNFINAKIQESIAIYNAGIYSRRSIKIIKILLWV